MRRKNIGIAKKDVRIETIRGKGPGGQHKNKTDSCVKLTHLPTGIVVTIDGRDQTANKRKAFRELAKRLRQRKEEELARKKKERRDQKIHERNIIRTYDFSRGVVKDHRTGKTAPLKQILQKGKLDLLR